MKKFIVGLFVGLLALAPVSASAINLGTDMVDKAGKKAGFEKATETTFASNVGYVINVALQFVGIIFTVLMVYAGYLWMTARGEESQIEKAQDIIKSSLIGIIITLAAYSISAFVVGKVVNKVSAPAAQSETK